MTDPPSIPQDPPQSGRSRLHEVLNLLGIYVLVIVLFVAGCLVSKKFLTSVNLETAVKAVTLLGIVCVGLSFITYSRHYVDLSIPGIMALSGTVAITALPYGLATSLAAGLATGLIVGLINGLMVGYLRLNPIIWTLAMMSMLSGLIRWAYGGQQVYPDEATAAGGAFVKLYRHVAFRLHAPLIWLVLPGILLILSVAILIYVILRKDGLRAGWPILTVAILLSGALATAWLLRPSAVLSADVPLIVVILVVLAIVAHLIFRKTGFGAQLKLTGSSYEVAAMTGVNVRRTVLLAFVFSAVMSATAGILLTSLNKVAGTYIGHGYDFAAITAVVLGGMTLAGGRGSIVGVMGGVMVIGLLDNVLSLVRIDLPWRDDFVVGEYHKRVIQGAVFILVVGLHSYSLRKTGVDDA